MQTQAVGAYPAFKGNLIVKNSGTTFIEGTLRRNPIFQNFVKNFNGDIYVDASYRKTPMYEVKRGADEELFRVYLSTKELPRTLKGIIKSWFDPAFRKTSLTRHHREERLIVQAIENEKKLKANLAKLNP